MVGYYHARKRAEVIITGKLQKLLGPSMPLPKLQCIVQFGEGFEGRELWRDPPFENKIKHVLDLSGTHFG